jgi:two-component system phosphate regulon response regulator PhoB
MRTIILVDDDHSNSKLMAMLLELDGFAVIICQDVRKARVAASNGADAFVIDCNLARHDDGVDLLKEIRGGETDASKEIPIIMTSGDDRRIQEAEEAGATEFLLKPFSPTDLSQKLNNLLN